MELILVLLNVVVCWWSMSRLINVDYDCEGRVWYYVDGFIFALNAAAILDFLF